MLWLAEGGRGGLELCHVELLSKDHKVGLGGIEDAHLAWVDYLVKLLPSDLIHDNGAEGDL